MRFQKPKDADGDDDGGDDDDDEEEETGDEGSKSSRSNGGGAGQKRKRGRGLDKVDTVLPRRAAYVMTEDARDVYKHGIFGKCPRVCVSSIRIGSRRLTIDSTKPPPSQPHHDTATPTHTAIQNIAVPGWNPDGMRRSLIFRATRPYNLYSLERQVRVVYRGVWIERGQPTDRPTDGVINQFNPIHNTINRSGS